MAVTYTPVTDWVVAAQATNTGSNKWLGAAARIVQASDSTETSFHLYGEYSFYQWYLVSGSGTNNVYKYLPGVDSSRFATSTPHEAIALGTSLTYPCLRGEVRRVELGTYGNSVSVTTPAFDCGWNGTTYSNAAIVSYTTPAEPVTNQNVNKVVIEDETLIDISADTVTEAVLLSGYTAHDRNGASIVGEYVDQDTTYSAGTGLSLSGTTFNHSNSITAGTIGQSSATFGNTVAVPYATYDAQGHITGKGTYTHTSWEKTTPWTYGNGFSGSSLYPSPFIAQLHDGFYALTQRGAVVTWTKNGVAQTTSLASLFNNVVNSNALRLAEGETAVITIDFSGMGSGEHGYPSYPYGYFYLQFYNTGGATSVSARVYNTYASQTVGWYNLTCIDLTANNPSSTQGTFWRIGRQNYYGMNKLEITIVGKTYTGDPGVTALGNIWFYRDRVEDANAWSFVGKHGAETLYYRLTAPQFKGVFEGNSSWYGTCSTAAATAAKVVTCSGFVLATGATIHVLFTTAQTATSMTLNVNSTGAKNVYLKASSIAPTWSNTGQTATFVYNGTNWICTSVSGVSYATGSRLESANTTFSADGRMQHILATGSMGTGKPAGDGHIIDMGWDNTGSWGAQLYLPCNINCAPQWRGQAGSSTWATMAWDTFYTHKFPPTFSEVGTATTESIGSASLGTAIAADDITAWSAGTAPSLTISTVAADDITAWSAGTASSATVTDDVLVLTNSTVPSLSYTARSIGSASGWSAGSVPSLSYTARSIPNVSVTSKTVVTGVS